MGGNISIYKISKKVLRDTKYKNIERLLDKGSYKDKNKYFKKILKKISKKEFYYLYMPEFKWQYPESLFEASIKDLEYQLESGTIIGQDIVKRVNLYLPGEHFFAYIGKKQSEDIIAQNSFIEGLFVSARDYVAERFFEELTKYIDETFPYITKVHSKKIKNEEKNIKGKYLYSMDFEIRAFGNEKKVELMKRVMFDLLYDSKYMNKFYLPIEETFGKYCFLKHASERYESDYFIIGGIESAKNIKLDNWYQEFEKREQPVEYLDRYIEKSLKIIRREIWRRFKSMEQEL